MGSGFYSFEEAANRLGRSKRSIHSYVKQGLLKRVVNNGLVLLRKEDVEQLAVELGSDAPAMNRHSFFQIQSRLAKLENEMVTIKHILEIRDEPLRPGANEAIGLYRAAADSLSRKKWVMDEVRLWADQFERMDEVAVETICKANQNPKAWVVFYDLLLEMQKYVAAQFSKKPDLEWQALEKKLDEGRKKLRPTIVILIEMNKGVSESFIGSLEDPKETLLRRLAR